eukprot:scaffold58283_cov41-Phaeocystis_antarctica.AAC.4
MRGKSVSTSNAVSFKNMGKPSHIITPPAITAPSPTTNGTTRKARAKHVIVSEASCLLARRVVERAPRDPPRAQKVAHRGGRFERLGEVRVTTKAPLRRVNTCDVGRFLPPLPRAHSAFLRARSLVSRVPGQATRPPQLTTTRSEDGTSGAAPLTSLSLPAPRPPRGRLASVGAEPFRGALRRWGEWAAVGGGGVLPPAEPHLPPDQRGALLLVQLALTHRDPSVTPCRGRRTEQQYGAAGGGGQAAGGPARAAARGVP